MRPFRKGNGRHRGDDQEGLGSGPPPPKSVQLLATSALFIVVGFAAAAIGYASVVQHDSAATALLGTLATAALAALVILSGGRHE